MPLLFVLCFPALEIYLFIKIGTEIGALAVLIWLVGAAYFGANLLRHLGATAMLNAARQMQSGAAPADTLAEAMAKAIAALLLIIPGFATDAIALLLLIPPLRKWLLKRWLRKAALKASFGASAFHAQSFGNGGFQASASEGNVYEHQGSATPTGDKVKSGQVLEHEPLKKK
jgi:UPF0716 protein FxsA